MKKKMLLMVVLVGLQIILGGCSMFSPKPSIVGKDTKQLNSLTQKVDKTENEITSTNANVLNKIGSFNFGGIQYPLDMVTNPSPEVIVAKQFSNRIAALSGNGDYKETEAIKVVVNSLLSTNAELRTSGAKALMEKDKEIEMIQTSLKQLEVKKNQEIKNALLFADKVSGQADAEKAELSKYHSFFGLGAVFAGLWQLGTTSFWLIVGLVVVYVIIRLLAASSPLAATILSVGEHLASFIIKGITTLFPKALHYLEVEALQLAYFTKKRIDSIKNVPVVVSTDNSTVVPPKI